MLFALGHIVYARGGALFAIPFDLASLKVTGESSMVLDGVLMSRNSGVANFDISATGDLVYMPERRHHDTRAASGSTPAHALWPSSTPKP